MTVELQKTLQQLDKQDLGKSINESRLVSTVHQLRNKPLKDFSVEDLRLLIGQNFSLDILIPLAIDKLKDNILAEGDFYPGDLLKSVLDSDTSYWKKHTDHWLAIKNLFSENKNVFEIDNSYKQIRNSFELFDKINNH
jgi:hypothetical protein